MKITINSVKFKTDKRLEDFILDKVNKLSSHYNGVINSEVTLKLDNAEDHNNKVAEIKLLISGSELFAKKQSKTFEESVDHVVDALRTQLIKQKEKIKGI
ncbi:MAG: ribosome-associated translation inhibitor RaiA [Bacteroidota bacterium]